MRKIDWANGNKYLASGSPVMLVGTSVTLLLMQRHIVKGYWGSLMFCFVAIIGGAQAMIANRKNRR